MDTQHQDNAQQQAGGANVSAGDRAIIYSNPVVKGAALGEVVAAGMSSQATIAEGGHGASQEGPGTISTRGADVPNSAAGDVVMDEVEKEKQDLPWAFIDCPTDDLVILIAHMLNRLMEHNDQVPLTTSHLTRFHSRAPPGISVLEYLRRIVRYTSLEKLPLLSLLAYIDTTCLSLPTFTLSSLTVHRFLISGVTAGSKALCDAFCTNAHYAKVGGIRVAELNALEREFLKITEWALCVPAELLQQYYSSLITSHGGYRQAEKPLKSPFTSFPLPTHPPRDMDEDQAGEGMKASSSNPGSIRPNGEPSTSIAAPAHSPATGVLSDRSSSVATSTACSPGVAERSVDAQEVDAEAMDGVEEASTARDYAGKTSSPFGSSDRKANYNAVASSSNPSPSHNRSPRQNDVREQNRIDSSRSRSSRGSSRSGQSIARGGQAHTRRPGELAPADRTVSTSSFASVGSYQGSSGAFHPKSEGRGAASPRVDTTPASGGSSGNLESRRSSMADSPLASSSVPFPVTAGEAGSSLDESKGGAVGRRLRDSLTRNDSDERQHAISLGNEKAVAAREMERVRRKSEDAGGSAGSGSGSGFGFIGGLFRHKGGGSRSYIGAESTDMKEQQGPILASPISMNVDIPERPESSSHIPAGSASAPRGPTDISIASSPRRRAGVSSSLPHPGSVTPLIRSMAGREDDEADRGEAKFAETGGTEYGAKRTRRDVELPISSGVGRGDGMDIAVG